jgi:hypothetical protein
MKTSLILIFIIIYSTFAYTQQNSCKVTIPAISESYTGQCKKGLAHGKGIAQGIDHFEGQFRKGMPNGTGVYTWADGTIYEGHWKNGNREGLGKMIFKDSVVTGYWKNDKYMGEKLVAPYKIVRSLNIVKSSFVKSKSQSNEIRIKLTRGAIENLDVVDGSLTLGYSSGSEYKAYSYYGIQNITFPLDVKVRFNAYNYLHTQVHDVDFEFTVNEPGTWDVTISY